MQGYEDGYPWLKAAVQAHVPTYSPRSKGMDSHIIVALGGGFGKKLAPSWIFASWSGNASG